MNLSDPSNKDAEELKMAETVVKKPLREALIVSLVISAPILLIGMVVGLIVAVFRTTLTGIF
jgi:flagellar biosynthesis protein FliQ